MSEQDNPLIRVDQDAVSSGGDQGGAPKKNDIIDIAERYDENKLILLPVNNATQHFYWEIADETLERKIVNREKDICLIFRLYYIVNGRRQEVESVYSHSPKGNYYAYHTPNMLEMEAEMFVADADSEYKLLTSNRITTPSNGTHSSPWEIWMTKDGTRQKLESRESDTAPEALTNPSSLDIVVREERLKARIGDMAMNLPSSLNSSETLSSWRSPKKEG